MKSGQASQTALWVCMARAVAHGRTPVERFSDPTAIAMLPDDERDRVERSRRAAPPRGWREKVSRTVLERRGAMMVARTVEIDDAIRAAANPQVVILGAGFDGRAWRMPELRDATVFEVDHPDSQRAKQARIPALVPHARDIRFVPVDFTRDRLDDALARASHDPQRPTTWVWEGVVMYLEPADVEATVEVVAQRSCAGSCLAVAYMSESVLSRLFGFVVRRVSEPLKSSYTPGAMRDLLGTHGFGVARDENVASIAAELSPSLALDARRIRHLRIATATWRW